MPERRGEKSEPSAEARSREKIKRLSAVARLRESPDFWVMKEFLLGAIHAHEKLLKRRVVTAQEQAEHHFQLGVLVGLDFAVRGTEIIEQSEQPPLANQK